MASIHKDTSHYLNTPIRDFYLDVLTIRPIAPSSNDTLMEIENKYDKRPDLFANDFYGSSRLWWILVLRNMDILIDPIEDFTAGTEIFVPNAETVQGIT